MKAEDIRTCAKILEKIHYDPREWQEFYLIMGQIHIYELNRNFGAYVVYYNAITAWASYNKERATKEELIKILENERESPTRNKWNSAIREIKKIVDNPTSDDTTPQDTTDNNSAGTQEFERKETEFEEYDGYKNCDNVKFEPYKIPTDQVKGCALLINNVGGRNRNYDRELGSSDIENLKTFLENTLHFDCYVLSISIDGEQINNMSKDEFFEYVDMYKKTFSLTTYATSFICLLGEGNETIVEFINGEKADIHEEIIMKFNNENFEEMRNKPKLFVFQTAISTSVSESNDSFGQRTTHMIPKWNDIFVFKAFNRDYELGLEHDTRFMEILLKEISENAHDTEIVEIFRKIDSIDSKRPSHPINQKNLIDLINFKKFCLSHKNILRKREKPRHYEMTPNTKGLALVINNIVFERSRERTGAKHDTKGMKETLEMNGIQIFNEPLLNLTKQQFMDSIVKFKEEFKYKNYNACFVVVMSHGTEDKILTRDEKVIRIQRDIIKQFSDTKCGEELNGKPKIFAIQACRGVNPGGISVEYTDDVPYVGNTLWENCKDMVVFKSSVQGHPSGRLDCGSRFIHVLCNELRINANGNGSELIDIFRNVANKINFLNQGMTNQQTSPFTMIGFEHFRFSKKIV